MLLRSVLKSNMTIDYTSIFCNLFIKSYNVNVQLCFS